MVKGKGGKMWCKYIMIFESFCLEVLCILLLINIYLIKVMYVFLIFKFNNGVFFLRGKCRKLILIGVVV